MLRIRLGTAKVLAQEVEQAVCLHILAASTALIQCVSKRASSEMPWYGSSRGAGGGINCALQIGGQHCAELVWFPGDALVQLKEAEVAVLYKH